MFFTAMPAMPNEHTAMAYDSDTQYCRSTIIHDILFHTWPSLSPEEKEYMLKKWIKVGLCMDSEDAIHGNMQHKHLKVIAEALRKLALNKKKKTGCLEKLITKITNDKAWSGDCVPMWKYGTSKAYKIPNIK